MKKNVLFLLTLIFAGQVSAQNRSVFYVHLCNEFNTSSYITYLDHELLNSNPDANFQVLNNWNPPGGLQIINDHVVSVYYIPDFQQWAIYNEDFVSLSYGTAFNIMIVREDAAESFMHTASLGNINENYTILQSTDNTSSSSGLVFETHNWNTLGTGGVYNDYNTGVWFEGSAWSVFNQSTANQVDAASYNIMMPGTNMHAYTHFVTAENNLYEPSYSILDHPQLNGHPEAIVLATQNWNPGNLGGTYNNEAIGVFYFIDIQRWVLYNLSIVQIPVGSAYNIVMGYPQPVNDDCMDATSIDNLFHQTPEATYSAGPYTNNGAILSDGDPTIPTDCFFASDIVNNNVWFSFVGDGEEYSILTSNCGGSLTDNYFELGDTQMAIYTGNCDGLSLVACNDDSENSTGTNFFAEIILETEDGVTYYVMIDGYAGEENQPADGDYCIEVTQNVVNVEENSGPQIALFPNPVNEILMVSLSQGVNLIQIMDASGRVVESINQPTNTNLSIDCSQLESGVYFIRANSNEGINIKTFVKQ
jgi:Secretion system C-terminal sorting domain